MFETIAVQRYPDLEIPDALFRLAEDLKATQQQGLDNLSKALKRREISDEQCEGIKAAIYEFKGIEVAFRTVTGDTEAFQFRDQLKNCLELAGWNVTEDSLDFTVPWQGVILKGSGDSPAQPIVELKKILSSFGLQVEMLKSKGLKNDSFEICVGEK